METIKNILETVNKAAAELRRLDHQQKGEILTDLAEIIAQNVEQIKIENQRDLVRMEDSNPKKDRLLLTDARIDGLIQSLREVASLADPSGEVLVEKTLDNGLKLQKIAVPLGVVGVIYESRPNVTIDVASLCIQSGNGVILRGGSDAIYSNTYLVSLIHKAMNKNGINSDAVQLLPTDRKFVKELLEADRFVDIIIPRGSQSLIDFVRENSKVPTIETGAGVCHTYIESSADLDRGAAIVVNAKVQRPSVCNSLDTILVDRAVAAAFLPKIKAGMEACNVEVYADEESFSILKDAGYTELHVAMEEDFGREYLGYGCSVKVVNGIEEALEHISLYSSKHSEAIITGNEEKGEQFLKEVDAAAVFVNASTRFTDGGVFGLGAEIGISTQKLHARGPFALEKLVTEKWIVRGNGQVRE